MEKERAMAIVIGLIMISSLLGYALNSSVINQEPPKMNIPTIVDRELSPQEVVYILRTGRVIIENFYPENCSDCLNRNTMLENFAERYSDYVVLVEVPGNLTRFQIIGSGGKITKLNETIDQKELMKIFCQVAIGLPKECLFETI